MMTEGDAITLFLVMVGVFILAAVAEVIKKIWMKL